MPIVAVNELRKSYDDKVALESVSFKVERGEVFALLGPNGAGKTTTIEILEGFRKRDSGSVEVLGFDPGKPSSERAFREQLGIVLQELAVEPFLTVREVLTRTAGYYPTPRKVDEVVELVGLTEKANARVKTLSGGQQRRLDVGLGIIGNPELIFLDEPTTGFDPSARRGAWDLVRALTGRGTTVILTTHYMDEADALADRVAVMADGRIVATGTPQSIGGRDVGEARVRFRLPDSHTIDQLPIAMTATHDGYVEIATEEETRVLYELSGWALSHSVELIGLTVQRNTLEDVYLRLTAGSDAPKGTA